VISNAATGLGNVVWLVLVAAFAPDEGERLAEVTAGSRDSVLGTAQIALEYPTPDGAGTATEFAIDPPKLHDAFAADLPARQAAVIAATQRPVSELAFTEPSGPPAWKSLPSWTVIASSDKAAGTDVVRSMAERAGATITEVEGSHVIMTSGPDVVADVIKTAAAAVSHVDYPGVGSSSGEFGPAIADAPKELLWSPRPASGDARLTGSAKSIAAESGGGRRGDL
jgi:hypothetical protein